MSIIGISFGSLAILGSFGQPDAGYSILGGGLFLAQGIVGLAYLNKEARTQ